MSEPASTPVLTGVAPAPSRAGEGAGASVGLAHYHSDRGLFPVQVEGVAEAYCWLTESPEPVADVLWQTGTGKTHWTMATAALMVEEGKVDQIIVVAEQNKIRDWVDDFTQFTDLRAKTYTGAIDTRRRILANPPDVLVMTYEMGRNDICTFGGKGLAVAGDRVLTTFCRGKRVFLVFDEFSRMRSRGTKLWTAWDYLVNRVMRRKGTKAKPGGQIMVAGLTATKIEADPEDHFDANLLLMPWASPSVAEWKRDHIAGYDDWGKVTGYRNLSEDDCEPNVIPLSRRYAHRTLKKRKSDPDVIGFFPAKVEERPRYIELGAAHREFYGMVDEIFSETDADDPAAIGPAFGLLRQIAAHPMSLTRSQGANARHIVDIVGAQTLAAMGSAKEEALVEWAREQAGEQGVIFTFYGQSVLPLLADRLRAEGFSVATNHGQMSLDQRAESQRAFKAGERQFFLSSDAGARGLNLGCGQALLHYELPLLYSTFVQRSDRIHRIDSVHESVTISALIATGTVAKAIGELLLKRNGWSDAVLEDDAFVEDWDPGEQFMSADMRRALWGLARAA